MKLEVGKSYVTRDGLKVTVHAVGLNLGGGFSVLTTSFESEIGDPAIDCIEIYTDEGRWVDASTKHERDIVSEYNAWIDVSVDARILVRNSEGDVWTKRHFAGWDSATGKVLAWERGRTSHTTENRATRSWNYAEIAE